MAQYYAASLSSCAEKSIVPSPNTRGICRLCGSEKDLSFEHIPPQRVGNTIPLQFRTLTDVVHGHQSNRKFRRGLGVPTLCQDCNTETANFYGDAYAMWSEQVSQSLNAPQPEDGYLYFTMQPLNVLKQILVMSLAMVADPTVEATKVKHEIAKHEDLREFVIDPTSKQMPFGYGVYSFRTSSSMPRFEGLVKILDFATGELIQVLAEIALPPLGHCVIGQSYIPPQAMRRTGLCPISWFSCFDFNETVTIPLRLPLMTVSTYFHLDYRTEDEVMLSVARQRIFELLCLRYHL